MRLYKTLLIIILASTSLSAWSAKPTSYVDERQELSCIVWKLAGAVEYDRGIYGPYNEAIETYFADHKNHPLIKFIKDSRENPAIQYNIAYNAITYAAELLKIENGGVKLNSKLDLNHYIQNEDPRWTVDTLKQYAKLLNDFYRKTKFDKFYASQKPLYDQYVASMDSLFATKIDTEWFESFYGEKFPELWVCISPACGNNNYAVGADFTKYIGKKGIGAIIGGGYNPEMSDHTTRIILGVLIHEISHSFSNPIFKPYNGFLEAGEKFFAAVPNNLTAAGYGIPRAVVGEFLNELFSMIYLREVLGMDLEGRIDSHQRHGFIWTRGSIPFMDHFLQNRDLFPTIKEFMPQLASHMNQVADNIVTIKAEYNAPPYVVSVFPSADAPVSANLKEVIVRFSRPMETGIQASGDPITEGVLPFLQGYCEDMTEEQVMAFLAQQVWVDHYTMKFTIQVPLESGKCYGVLLPGNDTRRADNQVPLKENYEIIFTVK